MRFDKDGNYIGLVNFPTETEEGADGNLYFIDKTVKKYADSDGTLKTIRGKIAVSEKKIKIEGSQAFVEFDINNNIYFDLRRGYSEMELPEYKLAVTDLSIPKMMIRYDFEYDTYDTLLCEPLVEKESKYVVSRIVKNYKGEIYEIRLFFNEPNQVTPEDHVRIYQWVKVEE
jgi:hypothetical protein